MSSMAEDEETQRRGLVTIGIIVSSPLPKKEDVDVFLHSSLKDLGKNLYRWCPLKCNAHHHWIQDNPTVVTHDETKRSNKADYATSKISQSQEDDIASDVSESSSMSGVTIFETIIGCMGKEYRLRTRLHKGWAKNFF